MGAKNLDGWTVPREWDGERCFILCGGASLQVDLIAQLRGRVIAVKQAVLHRPDADVMFMSGRDDPVTCRSYFPIYTGPRRVCRKAYPGFPEGTLYLRRMKPGAGALSRLPTHVAGLDAGASAINLAFLFGAREIVLLGMDMCGGRWVRDHHMPVIPQVHFDRHMAQLARMAPELQREGVRVVNCSPVTALRCFERLPLEVFL